MTADQIIARTMAKRKAAGLYFKVKYENREDFDCYSATREQHDKRIAAYRARIGVADAAGAIVLQVCE